MKILLVGPGVMEIPSKGWGAVETVIWQQKINLEKLGHKVDILNKRGIASAIRIKPWNYDLVHLHYDDFSKLWVILSKIRSFPLIITSHYGYGAYPEKWYWRYHIISWWMRKAPGLLVLSDEIEKTIKALGYNGWIASNPNGVEIEEIRYSDNPNKDAIYLGKIEVRKQQAKIASRLNDSSINLDFIGPIADENFKANNRNIKYLGSWTRDDVHNKLTDYKCLVLISDGEAHALVIAEALSAGLSLVISKEASANLDISKPFIKIVDISKDNIADTISESIKENHNYRKDIRKYAESFDWVNIAKKYEKKAINFLRDYNDRKLNR